MHEPMDQFTKIEKIGEGKLTVHYEVMIMFYFLSSMVNLLLLLLKICL